MSSIAPRQCFDREQIGRSSGVPAFPVLVQSTSGVIVIGWAGSDGAIQSFTTSCQVGWLIFEQKVSQNMGFLSQPRAVDRLENAAMLGCDTPPWPNPFSVGQLGADAN